MSIYVYIWYISLGVFLFFSGSFRLEFSFCVLFGTPKSRDLAFQTPQLRRYDWAPKNMPDRKHRKLRRYFAILVLVVDLPFFWRHSYNWTAQVLFILITSKEQLGNCQVEIWWKLLKVVSIWKPTLKLWNFGTVSIFKKCVIFLQGGPQKASYKWSYGNPISNPK